VLAMDIIKAIKQVSKVCPKGKENELRRVRFCAAGEDARAHVYATDGQNYIVAYVDGDLPDAALPLDALQPILKHKGECKVKGLGYGVIEFIADVVFARIQGENFDKFPVYPELPEMGQTVDVKEVAKVLHAAGTEKYEPQFAVLNFGEEWVEAYSGSRFARVLVSPGWTGLVNAKLFKAWPKGHTVTGSDGNHAFFRIGDTFEKIGDEVRIGAFQRQHYPDTSEGVPQEFTGNRIVVDTRGIKSAIETSIGVGKANWVRFKVDGGLRVYPFGVENQKGKEVLCSYENSYSASIPIQYCFQPTLKPCTLNLNGKYVQEALRQVKTHNVILGYGEDGDNHHPLRIESAGFTACVWQLVT